MTKPMSRKDLKDFINLHTGLPYCIKIVDVRLSRTGKNIAVHYRIKPGRIVVHILTLEEINKDNVRFNFNNFSGGEK